ncbi:hypothetical protein [Paraburkholderia atlantica]|uniref:hypothetical protein n=1 Tax=Paraburkholderia atlantica TaxID=2654982 RepID=UPI001614746F|nr:hypothetical protein [Paraburkholderia atlantica]MBB5414062.1 hypothetical protein [Paraburkholderia atlantica]
MSDCTKCGEYMFFPERHTCSPKWEVIDADECGENDWKTIHALDGEDAAAKYAEQRDDRNGEGPRERTVIVREPGASDEKRFSITFEYSVDYSAQEQS